MKEVSQRADVDEFFNTVEIELNHGCNKTCSYCPNSVSERIETGHMAPEVYTNLILQLKEISFKGTLSYSFYNEPTLSPNLENYIKMAKANLPQSTVLLYSNGTLINVDKYRALLKSGVDSFVITKHENVEDYEFEKTLLQLDETEKINLSYQHFSNIKLTNRGGLLKHIAPEINTNLLPCKISTKMLTVTLKGNVVPCFEDFYQKNQMGNIMNETLTEIWNSEKYINFRQSLLKGLRHKFDACKNCNRTEVL